MPISSGCTARVKELYRELSDMVENRDSVTIPDGWMGTFSMTGLILSGVSILLTIIFLLSTCCCGSNSKVLSIQRIVMPVLIAIVSLLLVMQFAATGNRVLSYMKKSEEFESNYTGCTNYWYYVSEISYVDISNVKSLQTFTFLALVLSGLMIVINVCAVCPSCRSSKK
jgi:hypothetical protein